MTTHGEPHNVSAITAEGRKRAKPKSATFSNGTPRGCPRDRSSGEAGFRSKFCKYEGMDLHWFYVTTYLWLDVPMDKISMSKEFERAGYSRHLASERDTMISGIPNCRRKLRTTISSRPPVLGCI